jgi:hypothetical protein
LAFGLDLAPLLLQAAFQLGLLFVAALAGGLGALDEASLGRGQVHLGSQQVALQANQGQPLAAACGQRHQLFRDLGPPAPALLFAQLRQLGLRAGHRPTDQGQVGVCLGERCLQLALVLGQGFGG